ncbi:MAG: hypothetical protein ACJ8FS_14265 [Sphingomicrobium sp.]
MKLKRVQWIGFVGLAFASTSAAQSVPGGWGGPGYGAPPGYLEPPGTRDPREGRVQVQTFAASTPAVAALGHGPITINAGRDGPDVGLFEAAIADQLGHAGYQVGAPGSGQALELVVTRQVIQPPELRHSPISGGVDVGVGVGGGGRHYGSYGSGVGLGIGIDLSKPLSALISTEVEVRIQDATTHELLWQGRAELVSREADKRWRPDAVAARVTAALFRNFPQPIRR